MTVESRQLGESDWRVLRELRLAALSDSPQAFWAEYAVEASYTEEQWTRFLRAATWFVAADDDALVGIVGLVWRAELPADIEVIGMWVAPERRHSGVATLLLDACLESLGAGASPTLCLWVVDGNDAALRCYESYGFRLTGERVALPRQPDLFESRMRLSGARSPAGPSNDRYHVQEEQCARHPS